jgi:hypothetical protein
LSFILNKKYLNSTTFGTTIFVYVRYLVRTDPNRAFQPLVGIESSILNNLKHPGLESFLRKQLTIMLIKKIVPICSDLYKFQ